MFGLEYLEKAFSLTPFEKQIISHEGMRLTPYIDSAGKRTIGIGWNIDDVPMREGEAIARMRNDLLEVKGQVEKFSWFTHLNEVRRDVIIEMVFNLGLPRFKKFTKMIEALQNFNYEQAADEMMDSQWAHQVKGRAEMLAKQMENGRM